MITVEQYFGKKLSSPFASVFSSAQMVENATGLLEKVNRCLTDFGLIHGEVTIDPDTGTQISGSKGGNGDGGFRLPDSTTGKAGSKHKVAHAVDVHDPKGNLDGWLDDRLLTLYGLYREHPDSTPGWAHLQDIPPGSGHRTFYP